MANCFNTTYCTSFVIVVCVENIQWTDHHMYCDCSALSYSTYSCEEAGCLPAALCHVLWISLCVCVCMCVRAAGHNPSAFALVLLCIPTSYTQIQIHTDTHTNTVSLSEIMFVPCCTDLFLGQQLQGLLNMWAREESYNMTRRNKPDFSFLWDHWILSSTVCSLSAWSSL